MLQTKNILSFKVWLMLYARDRTELEFRKREKNKTYPQWLVNPLSPQKLNIGSYPHNFMKLILSLLFSKVHNLIFPRSLYISYNMVIGSSSIRNWLTRWWYNHQNLIFFMFIITIRWRSSQVRQPSVKGFFLSSRCIWLLRASRG